MRKTYNKPHVDSGSTLEQTSLACTLRFTFTEDCYDPDLSPFTEICGINITKNNTFVQDPFGCSGGQNLDMQCAYDQNLS